MRLEDMLKDISGITNQVIKTNCFEGQNTLLESILLIQTKVNEVIQAINDGIIKGDKGDKGDTGETGAKGDKGDTGKATESIQDNVTSLDTTWSSTKIDNCFNDLKNIQGVKYGNDVGYQVCKGTHNGIVKDLKIYGKSLVNVFDGIFESGIYNSNTGLPMANSEYIRNKNQYISVDEIITINSSFRIDFYCYDSNKNYIGNVVGCTKGKVSLKTNTKFINFRSTDTNTDLQSKVLIVNKGLEVVPNHFERIASVGNGNEIEVLSRKEDGNLFNVNDFKRYVLGLGSEYSSYLVRDSRNCWYPTNYGVFHSKFMWDIRLDENVSYVIKFDYYFESANQNKGLYFRVYYTDGSFEYPVWGELNKWSTAKITTNPNKAIAYIQMTYGESTNKTWIDLDSIVIAKAKNYNDKLENKQDKKTILFKDTDNTWKPILNLRGIDENNCDIVDSVKGEYIKKYNQININKNLNIILNDDTKTNTIAFATIINDAKPGSFSISNKKCTCSRFKNVTYGIDEVGFSGTSSNAFVFRINKSDLQTQDIEGCKKWLENNSFDIVYESLKIDSYEINPIYPNSYEDETMILFNTGVIRCKNEFYIDSNLGSLQLETLDRLGRIEDYIYQSNVAILRGDFRTLAELYYPNDFIKEEELPNE